MISHAQLDVLKTSPPKLVRFLRCDLLSFSQEELARALDVSLHSIVRWERSHVRPNPKNWRKILALVEVVIVREREKRAR